MNKELNLHVGNWIRFLNRRTGQTVVDIVVTVTLEGWNQAKYVWTIYNGKINVEDVIEERE